MLYLKFYGDLEQNGGQLHSINQVHSVAKAPLLYATCYFGFRCQHKDMQSHSSVRVLYLSAFIFYYVLMSKCHESVLFKYIIS